MIKVGQIRQWNENKDHFKVTRIIGGRVHYSYVNFILQSSTPIEYMEKTSIEIPPKSKNFTTLYDKLNEV